MVTIESLSKSADVFIGDLKAVTDEQWREDTQKTDAFLDKVVGIFYAHAHVRSKCQNNENHSGVITARSVV